MKALWYEKEANKLEQEKLRNKQKYLSQCQSFNDVKERCKRATKLANKGQADVVSKVRVLQERVEEREKEIESLLKLTNEQRVHKMKSLEKLLHEECKAHIAANQRVETLSLEMQAAQASVNNLQQELGQARIKETAFDNKIRDVSSMHEKRIINENVDMDFGKTSERILKTNKRVQSTRGGDHGDEDDVSISRGDMDIQTQQDNYDAEERERRN